jgi:hypothetical protein
MPSRYQEVEVSGITLEAIELYTKRIFRGHGGAESADVSNVASAGTRHHY